MTVQKPDYQMRLALDLPEPEEAHSSAADSRLREEAAREALEKMRGKMGAPKWLEEYFQLRAGGWPWRVAAYIAWAATPRVGRQPKTQEELARNHLGLTSDRVISTWRRRNPAIDTMVEMLQSAPLFRHRAEIYTALVVSAVKPDYKHHNDRKLALELLGDYVPRHAVSADVRQRRVSDLAELNEDELDALAEALRETLEAGDETDAG